MWGENLAENFLIVMKYKIIIITTTKRETSLRPRGPENTHLPHEYPEKEMVAAPFHCHNSSLAQPLTQSHRNQPGHTLQLCSALGR